MSHRIKYSAPLLDIWNRYHTWCRASGSKIGEDFYHETYVFFKSRPNEIIQMSGEIILNLWYADYKRELLHVYLEEKELSDFIKEKMLLKDLQGIKKYISDNGKRQKDLNGNEFIKYDIGVHVPHEKHGCAFSFMLWNPYGNLIVDFVDKDGAGSIPENEYELAKNSKDDDAISAERNFRFAVNLITYMACFPECVRQGVPKVNNSQKYEPSKNSVMLGFSEKLFDSTENNLRGKVRPHLRKGYFKYLSSDFYTNKKGSLIWVKETEVNAESKTVEMSTDKEKLSGFSSKNGSRRKKS
ncbi:MAG: hypothetical protein HDR54_06575 [Treponema sp.]|nr:hypothetical protein [Treponema sp.]